ncbi:MAG: GLPGLI family protein [Roseivirga sp.]|nr:GLPGLI family protein [Roseivirga sp.]
MKKRSTKTFIIAIVALFITAGLYGQNFQGEATYQSSRKMSGMQIKMDGMTPQMEEQLKAQMAKQAQKEYTLKFNLTESVWKEVESLEGGGPSGASASGGNVVIKIAGSGTNGSLYKNTAELRHLEEIELFSKPFLIDDELESREWELTDETRKIGSYSAQKAIYSIIAERKVMTFGDGEDGEMKVISDTVKIEAWYTPEIPVSHGPDDYWGLPGLILEINDGTTTFLCTKVVLNPEGGVNIKVPSKGKKVNRKELAVIREEKTAEMMKNMKNGNGSFRISTGG